MFVFLSLHHAAARLLVVPFTVQQQWLSAASASNLPHVWQEFTLIMQLLRDNLTLWTSDMQLCVCVCVCVCVCARACVCACAHVRMYACARVRVCAHVCV